MKITMAHGSGGRASADLMAEVFGKHFNNPILDKLEDAAVLEIDGKIAYSTDSFVVTPLVFKGGDIGKLSVCGTANDLLMMGAKPKYLTCGFILEEGLDVDLLKEVVASMAKQAEEANITIVAGDTKVVEGKGGLMINTSGIGLIPADVHVSASGCKEGDKVILSGPLGNHHACILSHRMGIENNIESDCGYLGPLVEELLAENISIHVMRDVTRGGLGTVLNEISQSSLCSITLNELDIPLDDEVKGFCDILGLEPLYMGNEGKMILVVSEEDSQRALSQIKKHPMGKEAKIIGEVTEGDGVFLSTALGGKRVVDMLYGEGLPRIC